MLQECKETVDKGMLVYVFPWEKRRLEGYRNVFGGDKENYEGRRKVENKFFTVKSITPYGEFRLCVPPDCPDYVYTRADCFILGKIAITAGGKGNKMDYIKAILELLGKTQKAWNYDCINSYYSLDGNHCFSSEESAKIEGYITYTVEDFLEFCKVQKVSATTTISVELPTFLDSYESKLQRKESSLSGRGESGNSGVRSGGHRIKFAVRHLSYQARTR